MPRLCSCFFIFIAKRLRLSVQVEEGELTPGGLHDPGVLPARDTLESS